jgi:hypothetical protein
VYETVRTTPGRYLVVSGHEHEDRLVLGAAAYSVVTVAGDFEPVAAELPAAG